MLSKNALQFAVAGKLVLAERVHKLFFCDHSLLAYWYFMKIQDLNHLGIKPGKVIIQLKSPLQGLHLKLPAQSVFISWDINKDYLPEETHGMEDKAEIRHVWRAAGHWLS